MTSIHTLRCLTLAGLAPLLAASAFAQDGSYYYGGLSIGQSRANIDVDRISANVLGSGFTSSQTSRQEHDRGYKIFGGYQFNKSIGIEAGYFKLGSFRFNSATVPAGTLGGELNVQGVNLDVVGTLPLTENLSALARVGAQYARTRDTFTGGGAALVANPNPTGRGTNYKAGLGLQYAFSPSVMVRGEAERYRINNAVGGHGSVNLYSVSLVFPFGRAPMAAPPRAMAAPVASPAAPAPAPMPQVMQAQAPAPMPPPAPAPVAVVPLKRVSFSAESLFGFDRSSINPEGKLALDKFASESAGVSFDSVTVEGHTDRLGSTAYNQNLSMQRAEAVKAYLVTSGGFNPAKVTAVGKGETTAVTHAEDCPGTKQTAQLINCLRADRRVEIELSGTR